MLTFGVEKEIYQGPKVSVHHPEELRVILTLLNNAPSSLGEEGQK